MFSHSEQLLFQGTSCITFQSTVFFTRLFKIFPLFVQIVDPLFSLLNSITKSYQRCSILWPIPVSARSMAQVCCCSLAGITGSIPVGGMDVCLLCVLSGIGFCVRLVTRPEVSYRVWCLSVIAKLLK